MVACRLGHHPECQLGGELAGKRGLHTLTAATSHENPASAKVLLKAGFVPIGPADPAELGGKEGTRFRRDLSGR